jgi:similar to stage IV sporulation protein
MRKYGYEIISIPQKDAALAMTEVLNRSLPYIDTYFEEEYLKIKILSKHQEKYRRAFAEKGIDADFGISKGAFAKISRYFRRYGLIIGLGFMLTCVYFSSLFVWRIDIEGNINTCDQEILELLNDSGIKLGTFIPKINYDDVHNKFLIKSKNIAWISVNINGNIATVSVREKLPENSIVSPTYTNVVAKSDAQIYQVRLINGKNVVSRGDIVKKGEILVSGVIDSQSQGIRYTNANAEVLAYVNKEINIAVPLKISEKTYKEKAFKEKYITFFTNSINFSLKYNNSGALYDTIETRNRVTLFGRIVLPIEITTKSYREYTLTERTRSYDEAIEIAFSQLNVEMEKCLSSAELISRDIKTSLDNEYLYVTCKIYCIENIAELVEFKTS